MMQMSFPLDVPWQTAAEARLPAAALPDVPVWRAGRTDHPGGKDQDIAEPKKGRAPASAHSSPPARDALARRITAVHFPRLSIERWHRIMDRQGEAPPEDLPVALATEGPHGPVIHAVNRAADLAGVTRGTRVVDMRALCPELRVEYADIAGDRAALQRLMLWSRRWCPWTAVDGDAGLIMETTGSDHLMGGEALMLRDMEAAFSGLGLSSDLAVAPTHGAAWALSRYGGVRETCAPDDLTARMAPLTVRALRLTPDCVQLLTRLGLKSIGELAAVPRLSLARRFQRAEMPANPLLRLDQMMGRLAEPIDAPDDPPRFAVQARLAEPVLDPEPHLPDLAKELCRGLAEDGFGARRVALTLFRTDGEVVGAEVATARATRDADHIVRLFEGRLTRVDPGFGFDLITLSASVAEDLTQVQTRLEGGDSSEVEIARLTDRLVAKFGAKTLSAPRLHDSHIPERREVWQPAAAEAAEMAAHARPRPVRLFHPPEEIRVTYAVPEGPPAQFIWRRITHRVVRFAGPERVAPEWWSDVPGTRLRDYYRIEDHLNGRYWIYRDGVMGDGRGAEPRWFVHGCFA